ncbi:MAG: zinc ribbon domain-containing protein [Gammaproteobacteria bacterium]|jgi:putative FmdB family regulatory protein|nr:MAG: zinc ribbon domain-containing protein [Gammaproteobacteria bacterium]
MPFYEYQCSGCGHHHEELQKVSARPLRKCPGCGRNTLRRLVSAPVFRLKGSGWYETDFKAGEERKRNLAGDKEPAAEPAKEPAATAAKPADTATPAKPAEAAKPAAASPTPAAKRPTRSRAAARRRPRR